MSLRTALNDSLKTAMRERDQLKTSVLRLILAALKDRDIAERGKGKTDGLSNDEIVNLLKSMVKQRKESMKMYDQGGRAELAEREANEVAIIEGFLPRQMDDDETREAVTVAVAEVEATSLKDIGKVLACLRERFPGEMDFAKASAITKEILSGQ